MKQAASRAPRGDTLECRKGLDAHASGTMDSLRALGIGVIDHDEFFQERKPAAVVKHGVLRHYFTVFANMLGSRFGEVWFIDAYAGPGEYKCDDDSPAEPGSPRILCEIARDGVPKANVRGFFIEPDATYVAELAELVREHGDPGQHIVRKGTAEQHLQDAVAVAGSSPLFVFLDPFGVALSFDTLVTAIKSRPPRAITEVLLNFNVESVWRIGGYLSSIHPSLRECTALERVDDFVGGDWWRREFLEVRVADEKNRAGVAARAVAKRYQELMHERLGYQPITVPIRRRPNATPIFLLTLFFTNSTAAWVFADAASGANRDLRAFYKNLNDDNIPEDALIPREMLQNLSDQDFERKEGELDKEWVKQIAGNLRKLIDEHDEVPMLQFVFEIYGSTLGLARDRHIRKAWDQLAKEGFAVDRTKGITLRKSTIKRRES